MYKNRRIIIMRIKLIIALISVTLIICDTGYAAPSIDSATGNFSNGQVITISGSNFGIKTSARPVVWDNFESGTLSTNISGKNPIIGPPWTSFSAPTVVSPTYSNDILRKGSKRSALHNFENNDNYNISLRLPFAQNQYYFSFWYYYDLTSNTWAGNTKPWYMYGSGRATIPEPLVTVGYGDPSIGDGSVRIGASDNNGQSVDTNISAYGSPRLENIEGKWIRYEVWLVQSTPDTENGKFYMWTHVSGDSIYLSLSDSQFCSRKSQDYWNELRVGGAYNRNTAGHNSRIYIDDMYLDNTPARVEIGDSSRWNNCKHREIQIPTNWANSNISIILNQGSFEDGSTAYIYVVDLNNNVNFNGYPIEFGSQKQGDVIAPAVPTGVTISSP